MSDVGETKIEPTRRGRSVVPVSARRARRYGPTRDGERELLEHLLGAAPMYEVTIEGVQFVIPDGVDPYWESFRDAMGYELLPARERPQPTMEMHGRPPERPQDCSDSGLTIPGSVPRWRMPKRRTWPRPSVVRAKRPLVSWQALGDLRRAARFAAEHPLATTAPRLSLLVGDVHHDLVSIGEQVDELIRRLHTARTRPLTRKAPPDARRLAARLKHLDDVAREFSSDLRAYHAEMVEELHELRGAFADLLLTRAVIVPSDRSPRGAPPGPPLAFVHLARCILRAPLGFVRAGEDRDPIHIGEQTPSAELLAMIVALDKPHLGGHDFIDDERAALKYWRSELTQYARELKGDPPAPRAVGVLEPAALYPLGRKPRTKRRPNDVPRK